MLEYKIINSFGKKKKSLHEKLFNYTIDVTCYVIFIKYLLF